jgi:hypothetical protein
MIARTGQLRKGFLNRTIDTLQLRQDILDRTAKTGEPGRGSWDRTGRRGWLDSVVGQIFMFFFRSGSGHD